MLLYDYIGSILATTAPGKYLTRAQTGEVISTAKVDLLLAVLPGVSGYSLSLVSPDTSVALNSY